MTDRMLRERVRFLEQKVEDLASLPSRVSAVELQIVQLRDEMRVEFSAVRQEMAGLTNDLRTALHAELHGIRGEMNGLGGEMDGLRGEVNGLRDELHRTTSELRAEIRGGDEETRRYMRVLHEEVIARIATLGDPRG